MHNQCDKCGKTVEYNNSALELSVIMGLDEFSAMFLQDRHLYPIDNCEGSPSRVICIKTKPDWAAAYAKLNVKGG